MSRMVIKNLGYNMTSFPLNLLDKSHTALLLLFLALLGSHMLDYSLYIFIIMGLLLIDWRYVYTKSFLMVSLFLVSIYITWIFLDNQLLHNFNMAMEIFSQGILILLMYLLGLSVRFKQHNNIQIATRGTFYLLFIFVIIYSLLILWSYLTIQQDNPVGKLGMYVSFPNSYQRAYVNEGRLISTILAYYLSIMVFILPLILFYFDRFRKQGFYLIELFLLVGLALFLLYISSMMGRRTVILLFIVVFLFLFFTRMSKYMYSINLKKFLLFSIVFLGIFSAGYTLVSHFENTSKIKRVIAVENIIIPIVEDPKIFLKNIDIPVLTRLMNKEVLNDPRFARWSTALDVMMTHPFGGGNGVYIAKNMRLAHNTWIDIGKDFGILPFILFIMVTLMHVYYLLKITFSQQVEDILKYQLLVIGIGLFAIMMIEPVFTSDRTFFAYIFFYFGFLKKLYAESIK